MAELREEISAFSGGCLCGATRYEVAPGPAAQVLCFCEMCRRATGAPGPGFISVDAQRVTWLGTPSVYRSSDVAERGFCPSCGTALFYRSDGSSTIGLTAGAAERDFAPSTAFYAEARPDWLETAATLGATEFTPGPRETS